MSAGDPVRQAMFAAARLAPQIIVELVPVAPEALSRADMQRRLRRACEIAKELLTRLEVAETEFAAASLEAAAADEPGENAQNG